MSRTLGPTSTVTVVRNPSVPSVMRMPLTAAQQAEANLGQAQDNMAEAKTQLAAAQAAVGKPVAVAPAAGAAAPDLDPGTLKRLLHGAAAATLLVGDTGSGKTTLIATFAEWVWNTFHVPTRLYAYDTGGYADDVLALIARGIIEVWRVYTRDPQAALGLPSETIQRASQGWWPAEIDPATGECPLGVQLLSPAPEDRFAMACDGLTSMCDWSMMDMGQRAAKGTLGGEGSNMKTIESGDLKMGMGNRASVGFTQNKVRDWVLASLSIPNLVTAPIFTALELKVLDSETKLPLYGPKIAGQAKTTDVPAWFGATLGTCLAKDVKGRPQWRLYLRDYCWPTTDPTPHKCKIRSSAQLPSVDLARLPEFLADEPETPLVNFNLGYLFTVLEEIRLGSLRRVASKFPDAPGLKASTIGKAPASRRTLPTTAGEIAVAAPAGLRRAGAPAVAAPAAAAPVAAPAAPAPAPAPTAPQAPAAPASPGTAPVAAASTAGGTTRRPLPAGTRPK